MTALPCDEIVNYLSLNLNSWTLDDMTIKRDFKFGNFVEAFSFMTAVALEAEKLDHHPEWSNVYNQVNISLSTHSSNGVTQLDFDLASKIDTIYKNYE